MTPKILRSFTLITLVTISMLTLSGCFNFGGGNTNQQVSTDEKSRVINSSNYDFTITIPREWDMIEKKDFTKDVPAETVVVFRNNVKNEDYTATVVVSLVNFQTARESLEAAKYIINKQKTTLYNYKDLRDPVLTKVKIGNQQADTYISYFEGKEKPESQTIDFIQTYASKGNVTYSVTGSISTKEDANNRQTVENIVKSFALK